MDSNQKYRNAGLNQGVGGLVASVGFGIAFTPKDTCFTKFWMPDTTEALASFQISSAFDVLYQDQRVAGLKTVDFADMKIETSSKPPADKMLLGARELAVLLTNFVQEGELSVLEQLRIKNGTREMIFPGTKFLMTLSGQISEAYYLAAYDSENKRWVQDSRRIPKGQDGWPDEFKMSFACMEIR